MKLYIEKEVHVLTRNILGEPLESEDWYYIYTIIKEPWWTGHWWGKKQYLNIRRRGFYDGRKHPVDEEGQTFDVIFSDSSTYIPNWTKAEAEYFISDIQSNPNKYILL